MEDDMITTNDRGGVMWLIQVFSGMLLIFLLGLHMIAHHFIVEGGLRDYEQVLDYISNRIVLIIEIVFLMVVTIHALLGLKAIINDLDLSKNTQKLFNRRLMIIGILTIIYGIDLEILLYLMI